MKTTDIIAIIAASIIFAQLLLMYIAYRAENERKRKQSTIEYINSIRTIYVPIRNKLNNLFPGTNRVINLVELNEDLKLEIREILSTIEHLSVGINTGVYDFDIFFRMSASYFFNIFNKLRPYIQDIQRDQPTAFIEFEAICKKITKERETRNLKLTISAKGKIRYS